MRDLAVIAGLIAAVFAGATAAGARFLDDFDGPALEGDTVNGQLAIMDWGLGNYRVDVVEAARSGRWGPSTPHSIRRMMSAESSGPAFG